MQIRAAVARSPHDPFTIEEVDLDDPRDDEIEVRIAGVGLCHTDLAFKAGAGNYPLPAVLGHEGAGIVTRVGTKVTRFEPGDRVSITFRSCGTCDRCVTGDPAYCRTMPMLNYTGRRTDGSASLKIGEEAVSGNFFGQSSFGTYAVTYERNLVKLPDDVPIEMMGPLGCGIQTGVGSILRSLDVQPGSSLIVFGGGAVGLSAVVGGRIRACEQIILVEPHKSRRELALELGATHAVDPDTVSDVVSAIRSILPRGADYAFDTSGVPAVQAAAVNCLGSKGVLGLVGISPAGTPLPGEVNAVMTLGIAVKGIIEGDSNPEEFIPELIGYYRDGRLPLDRLITTYPLDEINRAVADLHAGRCVKAVLLP